jgi:hypothetical protein
MKPFRIGELARALNEALGTAQPVG